MNTVGGLAGRRDLVGGERAAAFDVPLLRPTLRAPVPANASHSSDTMCSSIVFGKSTPPQNREL